MAGLDHGDGLAAAEASLHACNQQADIERTTREEVDVVRLLNKQTWDSARVKEVLEHGVLCANHTHEHAHEHQLDAGRDRGRILL